MKKYAIYLPQFHEIPENNRWWGKGFTEWTNVKKANSLFDGHMQPKVPLDNNYYCLDNKKTLEWQSKIAKEYGIDGMVFYHYYFTGKKLLQKPAEMLLENKNIEMNFYFCWANHSWYRSWEGSKEILVEQNYGNKTDWEKHFNYLLPFFKDERYEKKNNKPIFMIFKTEFDEKKSMLEYFNERCIEYGFDGIFIIETVTTYNSDKINELLSDNITYDNYVYIREPDAALVELKKTFKFNIFKIYNKICKELKIPKSVPIQRINGNWLFDMMIKKRQKNPKIIRGVFFEWDNTPRHKNRGFVILPVSKNKFFEYMESIRDQEFLIINAWNEWCEGMILEPTEENGYKYLDWIKEC